MLRSAVGKTHVLQSGLVMGLTDCINYAGLVKTLENSFKRKLGPLPDTL